MGGGSSSSSSSNTTNNTNSQVSVGGENTGLILSNVSGSSISVTDHNAINSAMELANNTLELQGENYQSTLETVEELTGQFIGANEVVIRESYGSINENLDSALAFVKDQNSPDGGLTVEIIKPIVYGSAAVAMAYLVARSIK